jgi:hypothetical protein
MEDIITDTKKIREIKTKKEFVSFAFELSESFYDDPESWHNSDLGTYLEALGSWVNDMESYYKNRRVLVPENPDWQLMANMLDAGREVEDIKDILDMGDFLDLDEVQAMEEIKTKEDFVSYVYELSQDYYDDPESWENIAIDRYLEALSALVNDMDGYYKNQGLPIPENPDWQLMADILSAARFYE